MASNKRPNIQIVEGPVTLADGTVLGPLDIKTPRDALRATMMMLFQHVADVHYAITEIISEKYNIPEDEIYGAITEHPKWQEMLVNPMIRDLTGEIAERAMPVDASETESVASDAASAASGESATSAKKRGRPKGSKWTDEQKAAAAAKRAAKKAAAAAPVPAPVPEPTPVTQPVKSKKKRAIKVVDSLEEFQQLRSE